MRALLLVVSFASVVLARPDIGLDLRSKPLATSYGVPSASITNLEPHSFLPPSASFQTPLLSTAVPFYSGPISSTEAPIFEATVSSTPAPFYSASVSTTPAPFYTGSVSTTPAPFYHGHISTAPPSLYAAPFLISPNPGLPILNQQVSSLQSSLYARPAHVQKHVYFYEAPDEPEEIYRPTYPVVEAKKNVKIIFIKAPHYAGPVYPAIQAQQQNQEKTIVYVLVKKPDELEPIVVPTLPPTPPAKPEVYFIKYKNQQEAEEKVSNTLNEHSNSGANIITNGIDTAHISGGSSIIGNPFIGNQIISTTESPLGLVTVDNGIIGTSTVAPFIDNSFLSGVSVTGNGLPAGHFVSTTEPTIISSPYTFAPIHPTYGPPRQK